MILVGFDRTTGARLFESPTQLNTNEYHVDLDLELGPTTVWVQWGTGLQAYERTTGALRWRTHRP